MHSGRRAPDLGELVARVMSSVPLRFIRGFLRQHARNSRSVRIGTNSSEVETNLRDALAAKLIGFDDVEEWLSTVEGWGHQHLYLRRLPKHLTTHAPLMDERRLRALLERKGLIGAGPAGEAPMSQISYLAVADSLARIEWRAYTTNRVRRPDLDKIEETAEGEIQYDAYQVTMKVTASRILIRKNDGVALLMVDKQLGEEHDELLAQLEETLSIVSSPLAPKEIPLAPIVRDLDADSLRPFGPKPKRDVSLTVAAKQTKFRADGGTIEFRSVGESTGYAETSEVRHVRRALQVEKFEGESGKFRLTFEGDDRRSHSMVVSLGSLQGRIYLFSRMEENEVLALVDLLLSLG